MTRAEVFQRAWPIIVANAATPLLGLADTAVIGRTGTSADLGAIALGSLIFNFIYWGFGFLRMGTTGFVAQAAGAGDEAEVRAALGRAVLLALGLGFMLLGLRTPLEHLAFGILSGDSAVEATAGSYYRARIWGAPASLGIASCMGCLVGLGKSRLLLFLQLFLNGLNIVLDIWFAGSLGWGARGIAIGTAVAEWATVALASVLIFRLLWARHRDPEPLWPWARIRGSARVLETLTANADILVRTLFMLLGFGWFTDRGADFGTVVLASNHLLLQFVTFSAFFLDGYAFVAESVVGAAVGGRDRARFDVAVRRTTELAGVTALALAVGIAALGPWLLSLLTDLPAVRALAGRHLPFACIYVLVSFAAFQLDGIFIGATRTRAMRNASILAVGVFIAAGYPLIHAYENAGLWLAFIIYVSARAVFLGAYLPALRRDLAPA